jgi:hypothetical protein
MRWTFKKQTTLRISTRVSQHPRSKTLLSKQRRARRRKFWLRALVRKKKKKKKKETVKENMMKMKWLYSSRNLISSSRREDLTREKGKRSQGQRVCYNCGKNVHFIVQCSYERKEEDNDKRKKFDKCYKKDNKYTKKKSYGQAHVSQEWKLSDESSESESDEVTTIAIKGKTSSSKSLFPKLSKHTCLMAKKGRKKVKSNTPSSLMYVTNDEDTLSSDNYNSSNDDNPLPSELVKNPNAMIKGLMIRVRVRDELLEQ